MCELYPNKTVKKKSKDHREGPLEVEHQGGLSTVYSLSVYAQ